MPLPNQSVDIVLAAWAFGAISDLETRNQAFSEAERVIRKGNPIYVIENNGGCEFEQIIKNNTSNEEIQDWLLSNHFSKVSIIQTYFQFSNLQTAREIFCELGDANLSTEVSSSKVQHNIAIYAKVVA